jgi:hypothetical protein
MPYRLFISLAKDYSLAHLRNLLINARLCYSSTVEVIEMSTRQKIAEQLLMKEERVNNWERYSMNNGLLDRDFCEIPKVEYWYIEER